MHFRWVDMLSFCFFLYFRFWLNLMRQILNMVDNITLYAHTAVMGLYLKKNMIRCFIKKIKSHSLYLTFGIRFVNHFLYIFEDIQVKTLRHQSIFFKTCMKIWAKQTLKVHNEMTISPQYLLILLIKALTLQTLENFKIK